jgi:type VI secretion system protein
VLRGLARPWALVGVLVLAVCTGGCAASLPWRTGRQVQVEAQPGANQGNATELDIVFVYEKEALALLPKTGPKWFQSRAALRAALGSDIAVLSLQVPSASPPLDVKWPKRSEKSAAVLSFANYLSAEGRPVGDLTAFECVRMTLTTSSVDYIKCR